MTGYLREVLDAAFRHSEEHQCGVLNTGPDPSTFLYNEAAFYSVY